MKLLVYTGLLIIANLVFHMTGFAQANPSYDKFMRSIASYPSHLTGNCIPTMALLKIETDAEKQISNVKLSDSIDSLFRQEFENSKRMDLKSLENYLKAEFGSSTTRIFLIPLFYSVGYVGSTSCPVQSLKIEALAKGYSAFNGDYLTNKEVIFLAPITFKIRVTN